MSERLCIVEHDRPVRAADSLTVCPGHAATTRRACLDLAAWHDHLIAYLASRGGTREEIKHKDAASEPMPIEYEVQRTRENIRLHLSCWVRIGLDEGPWRLAPEGSTWTSVWPATRWLATRNDWYCAQPWADEYVRETLYLRTEAERLRQPNPAKRITLKDPHGDGHRCPEPNCDGTLIAVIRPADDLLPPEVRCDRETEHHAWTADQWLTLGRRVLREESA